MIDISIILPIYNIDVDILAKCLNSIEKQSAKNFEVILVNDGSKQEVLLFCESFVKTKDLFKLITIKNSGVSVARNVGMDNSIGKWVCFIDPDDWIDENYIKDLWSVAKNNEFSEIIISDCYVNIGSKDRTNNFLPQYCEGRVKNKNILLGQLVSKKIGGYYPELIALGVPWCKLFKKEFIDSNRLRFVPGLKRMQDNVFCFEAFIKSNYVYYIKSREYHYRKEEGSASFKYNEKIYEYFMDYFIEIKKVIDDNMGDSERYKKALSIKRVSSFNSYFKHYIFHKDNDYSYREKKFLFKKIYGSEKEALTLSISDFRLMSFSEVIFYFLIKLRMFFILKIIYAR